VRVRVRVRVRVGPLGLGLPQGFLVQRTHTRHLALQVPRRRRAAARRTAALGLSLRSPARGRLRLGLGYPQLLECRTIVLEQLERLVRVCQARAPG